MKNNQERKNYWKQHLSAFKKSGLTQRKYCMQYDLGYWSFSMWKRRFEKAENGTGLHEVKTDIFKNISQNEKIEIIINNSIRIAVPENFSEETLKRLIAAFGESL